MFLGDIGTARKHNRMRLNYDILIDQEKFTLQKLSRKLGFYSILFKKKIKEVETIYDTEKNLLTGSGLIIRKKTTPRRTYFSLIRVSSLTNVKNREKKSFLGECELHDQPSDFPVQIADEINKVFQNLFSIDVVEIVKHCTPYLRIDITGNRYKIISGTGYEAEISFETLKVKDMRTGKKAKQRIFSLDLDMDSAYERERQQILDAIETDCKELVFLNRNNFEIAEVLVKPRVPTTPRTDEDAPNKKKDKKKKQKKIEE